jgi:hypothetical protein
MTSTWSSIVIQNNLNFILITFTYFNYGMTGWSTMCERLPWQYDWMVNSEWKVTMTVWLDGQQWVRGYHDSMTGWSTVSERLPWQYDWMVNSEWKVTMTVWLDGQQWMTGYHDSMTWWSTVSDRLPWQYVVTC